MQKLLSLCGLLALLGFAAPALADAERGPFFTPAPFPHVVQPLPLGTPLFNIARPFVVTQFRWQIVTVQVPGQAGTFILLVDTVSGTSFLLRPDAREPAGYSWQWLPRP